MTERKPAGLSVESWVDRQIRAARERGEFDDLPGLGKPLPDLGGDDELSWVKKYVEREGLSTEALLPPAVQLRKEIDRLPSRIAEQRSEQAVRELVEELNIRVVEWLRAPTGPKIRIGPVDVESMVAHWRQHRTAESDRVATATAPSEDGGVPEEGGRPGVLGRLCSWWRGNPRG
ncbi:DnaJ family domain-containing protein [Actinopolyspora mortivallis]|uniref:DUF1992 domain-containing protein n=1 Tax=Actinopolyspora mortivallis TaxID=33906 RepID=A0A2T0GRZ9_ACTMO|nr:DUF1992 domain-containing protein [Actinopolyspora mortivallis]PRW61885.1 DUF1992 domain-containing protein [Actinopolyspora mortivallis]